MEIIFFIILIICWFADRAMFWLIFSLWLIWLFFGKHSKDWE